MSAQARVERLYSDDTVQLQLLEPTPCSGCEGNCLWRRSPASALRVRSSLALQPDDVVTISIDRHHVLRGALLLHGLPWAGLLGGAVAGLSSVGGDPGALLGAVAGLAAGSMLARYQQARWQINPVLTRGGRGS